jgi:hypothetical protein
MRHDADEVAVGMNAPTGRDDRSPNTTQQVAGLLRAYEQQQITWQEMQERFDQLVTLYGMPDGAEARRPRTRQPTATARERLNQLRRGSPGVDPPHVE